MTVQKKSNQTDRQADRACPGRYVLDVPGWVHYYYLLLLKDPESRKDVGNSAYFSRYLSAVNQLCKQRIAILVVVAV